MDNVRHVCMEWNLMIVVALYGLPILCSAHSGLMIKICDTKWFIGWLQTRHPLSDNCRLPLDCLIAFSSCRTNLVTANILNCWFICSCFIFYPRDAMLARVIVIATCLSVCPSVCLSVRPSRAGIVSKRRKLAAWFLHHLVAPRL